MKKIDVTLTTGRTGPNGPENRGDTVKVSVAEATRLVDAGFAETPKKGSAEDKAIAAHRKDLEAETAQAAQDEAQAALDAKVAELKDKEAEADALAAKVEAAKAANGKTETAAKGA
jgi:hypothetical protein